LEPNLTFAGGDQNPQTIIEVFQRTVERHGSKPCLHSKRKDADGVLPEEWSIWTWQQYWDDCMRFAKSLVHLKVDTFKVVNIIGFNSPEWFIANSGSILGGCIAAGIYTTNNPDACFYVSDHSKAEVVCLDSNEQLKKYAEIANKLKHLKALVLWGEEPDKAIVKQIKVPVYKFDDFLELGKKVKADAMDNRAAQVKPGNCSTLIYTSGTTGPPKAVMISHDNVTWTTKQLFDNYVDINHEDRIISYLPLSHIAAQIIDLHAPMYIGAQTWFAQPDALKGSLTKTLAEVRPAIFFGVPRVWEKIAEAMGALARSKPAILRAISGWAKSKGAQKSALAQYGEDGGVPPCFGCANLLLSSIKKKLGLDRAKGCFTAAAPISEDILKYFASLDIPVYEVFGQSECTGPHTVSSESAWRIGYCGRPMPGTETKLIDGELCYRGRHIFMGYMHMPEKTGETIDKNGFLHSGDVAEFDDNDDPRVPKPSGFMKITGRIKDLIITAGGENIPPVLIENEMKAAMIALSNCMVVGDRQKYLAMLISLKTEVDKESGEPTDVLAADSLYVGSTIGSTAKTMTDASKCPKWTEYINKGVKAGNAKTTSRAQVVQKWKMLPVDFSEKAGDLTPTLKLKRNVATKKYEDLIAAVYA
jgi:long-chain-fatty-acid--CoA ligase ACSBG